MLQHPRPMPQLFESADQASIDGQRIYLLALRLKLALLILAAACGLRVLLVGKNQLNLLAIFAVVLFLAALFTDAYLWQTHPEKKWYNGRALAESVKTLAWKFAVCGDPFPALMPLADAKEKFLTLCDDLKTRYATDLPALVSESLPSWLSSVRASSLDDRRSYYLEHRLQDQQDWYAAKSKECASRSRFWRIAMLCFEFLGLIFGFLAALSSTSVSVAGLLSSVVGAIGLWLAAKQFDLNSSAYSTAVVDLSAAATRLELALAESDWAREMNDAEDAISREHTLWLASRSY